MLILAAVFVQMADLFTFAIMVDKLGIGSEANPFAVWMYGLYPPVLVFLKVGVVGFVVVVYELLLQARLVWVAMALGLFTFFIGLIGAVSNILTIMAG